MLSFLYIYSVIRLVAPPIWPAYSLLANRRIVHRTAAVQMSRAVSVSEYTYAYNKSSNKYNAGCQGAPSLGSATAVRVQRRSGHALKVFRCGHLSRISDKLYDGSHLLAAQELLPFLLCQRRLESRPSCRKSRCASLTGLACKFREAGQLFRQTGCPRP